MKITVPIPERGENNLESLFLKAQSGDPQAVKAYEEKLKMNRNGNSKLLRGAGVYTKRK